MPDFGKNKALISVFIAAAVFATGVFCVSPKAADAKVTKWQKTLERNHVPRSLWAMYLPTINHSEYDKATASLRKSKPSSKSTSASLGPEIAVGLWYFGKNDVFRIEANKTYNIRRSDGSVIARVSGGTETKVKYGDDGNLIVYGSISTKTVNDKVIFDAADGNNSNLILDIHRSIKPEWGDYSHVRGKIEVNYYRGKDIYGRNLSKTVRQIWVINKLPLEQYAWGSGETTGTGNTNGTRALLTAYRTYGKWYIDNANKYKSYGFKIRSDAGSQLYLGYDREKKFPKVRKAAEATRGYVVVYKGDAILAAYCSSTDGRTRKLSGYPYLKSVSDPYGKRKGLRPGQGGNHMWGLSANGAFGYAKHGKSWIWILTHYYSKTSVSRKY